MSPAPETLRRPSNVFSPPGISIASVLSRTPRAPNDSPGPFSADRRAASIRRNFSGGPRPAPFPHSVRVVSVGLPRTETDQEAITTQDQLITALESRRRRIEELRNQSGERDIATTIARQWRGQEARPGQVQQSLRPALIPSSSETSNNGTTTPIRQTSPPLRVFSNEASDTDSEDDDPDNKFSTWMHEIRTTPPPTFLTPNTSPSSRSELPLNPDDESSRNAYTLSCKFCANVLTRRGMRARLVADARIHIWSTDEKPRYPQPSDVDSSVKLVGRSYATTTCECQLM